MATKSQAQIDTLAAQVAALTQRLDKAAIVVKEQAKRIAALEAAKAPGTKPLRNGSGRMAQLRATAAAEGVALHEVMWRAEGLCVKREGAWCPVG